MTDATSSASSSSAGFAEDTIRLIARCDRPGFNEMLEHELRGRGGKMKEALQTTRILVVWIVFWLGGTAVLQARLIDIGVVSDFDPPWIITIGSSFIGFFAGAYAAVKLGDLKLRKNDLLPMFTPNYAMRG
jgi:hypothetical protein